MYVVDAFITYLLFKCVRPALKKSLIASDW